MPCEPSLTCFLKQFPFTKKDAEQEEKGKNKEKVNWNQWLDEMGVKIKLERKTVEGRGQV